MRDETPNLTDERLRAAIHYGIFYGRPLLSNGEDVAALTELLARRAAAADARPVAWLLKRNNGTVAWGLAPFATEDRATNECEQLSGTNCSPYTPFAVYAHPPAAPAPVSPLSFFIADTNMRVTAVDVMDVNGLRVRVTPEQALSAVQPRAAAPAPVATDARPVRTVTPEMVERARARYDAARPDDHPLSDREAMTAALSAVAPPKPEASAAPKPTPDAEKWVDGLVVDSRHIGEQSRRHLKQALLAHIAANGLPVAAGEVTEEELNAADSDFLSSQLGDRRSRLRRVLTAFLADRTKATREAAADKAEPLAGEAWEKLVTDAGAAAGEAWDKQRDDTDRDPLFKAIAEAVLSVAGIPKPPAPKPPTLGEKVRGIVSRVNHLGPDEATKQILAEVEAAKIAEVSRGE